MLRWPFLTAAFAALFLAAAPAAYTCTPLADIDIPPPALNPDEEDDPARLGGEPPAFPPGAVATVNGVRFDAGAATPITLRWGSTGPAIAQAPIGIDGTWTVTFQLPADIPDGTYVIYAEAFAADGSLIEGLPAREFIRVLAPAVVQPPAPVSPPAASPPAPPAATRPATRPKQVKQKPQTRAVAVPRPKHATTVQTAPVTPRTIPVAPLPPGPVALPLIPAPADGSSSVTHVHRFAPAPRVESAPLPKVAAPGESPALAAVSAEAEPGTSQWLILALGGLGLLLIGAAGGGFVLARRWPPVPPTDVVEAELQELIAEQRVHTEEIVRDG